MSNIDNKQLLPLILDIGSDNFRRAQLFIGQDRIFQILLLLVFMLISEIFYLVQV